MPDQQQGQKSQGKGKILGMPRTTGLIVIAGVALVVGYLVISHFSKSSSSGQGGGSGGGGKQGGRGGSYWWGSGRPVVYVIHEWQGHHKGGSGK
jgi:hypothetical protein